MFTPADNISSGTSKDINLNLKDLIQESYHKMFRSEAKDLLVYGGNDAGKTYAVAQKLLFKCLMWPNRKAVVIRKRTPSLKITCWDPMLELIGKYNLGGHCKINHTDLKINFTTNNSQMLFLPVVSTSGEPGERLKSLTDVTDLWIEEATELTEGEWNQIKLRVRGKVAPSYRQRILTFNPYDANHWINRVFFLSSLKGVEKQRYTWRDNKFATSVSDIEAFKDTDPYMYTVASLGDWGHFEHQIYRIPSENITEFNFEPSYYDEYIGGVDYGFEHPSVFLLIGIKEKKAYLIAEVWQRKLLNADFITMIKDTLSEYVFYLHQFPAFQEVPIYCDTAEPMRIEEMHQAGLLVYPAEKNVLDGINTVKSYDLIIHDRCEHAKRELLGYRRMTDKNDNVLEQPVKANDHVPDALRYALYTHGQKAQPNIRIIGLEDL